MAMYNKHVFAIWGANGAGKTTLAANMAVVLADSGYMTCLVSASDHGELQAFFGTAVPKDKGLYAAISSGRNVREALIEARPNLCLLELDTGGDAYDIANVTPKQVKDMLADLRDQFSYVIIDCTNYKESVFTGLGLVEADKVITCIPHRVTAATWHFANAQMLDALGEKTFFVDVDTRDGGCNMEQLLASIGLPECDIRIPCVNTAYECENESRPIVLQSGRSERRYKKAILTLIKFLLDIEDEESATAKKNRKDKASKRSGNSGNKFMFRKNDDYRDCEEKEDDDYDDRERVRRDKSGVHRKMSSRDMRRAEDEAMRRARGS